MTNRTVGLLGGGQLGQMLCEAANPLGVKVVILDAENSPAKQVNAKQNHINGSFTDPEKIRQLAREVDVITVEIEHVDTVVLEEIAERGVEVLENTKEITKRIEVQPSWKTLRIIQDKFAQKGHLAQYDVPVALSKAVERSNFMAIGQDLGFPFMLKARKDAYDGRGNYPVMKSDDIDAALEALTGRDLYAEQWADFKMELAVMVVKTKDQISAHGEATIAYPAVETIHEDSICKLVYAPARNISQKLRKQAQKLARKAVGCLWGKGVFGVEMFVMKNDRLLVNEIAPRPHNSGHYTIEACPTMSQFKAQLLSILDLMPNFPKDEIETAFPATIMLNILGGATKAAHTSLIQKSIQLPTAALHLYGKEPKPARKIGHITIVSGSMSQAEFLLAPSIHIADSMRAERKGLAAPNIKEIPGGPNAAALDSRPRIAVTMGSDSDLSVLKPGLTILDQLSIPYHLTITSAHRTPTKMTSFAQEAVENGFKVIIAAAGGAAHLPGMIAASTPLPVIGVPVKGSNMDGMDSLLSIVQMPRGVPVATVAINNSVNAALLAARILGASDEIIRLKVEKYAHQSEEEVIEKSKRLENSGWEEY